MANVVYTSFIRHLGSGQVNLNSDPIYVMLVSGTYTPNTGHSTRGDVLAHQCTDPLGSYKSGGQALAGRVFTSYNGDVVWDANDVSWTNATLSASGAVLWQSGVTRDLITFIDLGNTSSTNGTFQIVWNNTTGILRLGVS